MPQSIPLGLTRDHVLRALDDLDAGADHPFGPPTRYELLHRGRRYPPKAVVGLAFRHSEGRMLAPEEFSGGEAAGQANAVLRGLGFVVGSRGNDAGPAGSTESERARRTAMWDRLVASGGPEVAPATLREIGIYGGAQGIWVDKARTAAVQVLCDSDTSNVPFEGVALSQRTPAVRMSEAILRLSLEEPRA